MYAEYYHNRIYTSYSFLLGIQNKRSVKYWLNSINSLFEGGRGQGMPLPLKGGRGMCLPLPLQRGNYSVKSRYGLIFLPVSGEMRRLSIITPKFGIGPFSSRYFRIEATSSLLKYGCLMSSL